MRFVKPKVFLIAKTCVIHSTVIEWLQHLGCSSLMIDRLSNYVVNSKTDAERLIELTGRRCYMSFEPGMNPNVQKIREDIKVYIENILASGHGSVLEHVTFTFAIEGVSRVFTGEMNRHRAGVAISEGSMRYIRYDDIPIVDVPSIQEVLKDSIAYSNVDDKRGESRALIESCVKYVESFYKDLVNTWKDVLDGREFKGKKHITSMLRRIIPMGVATGGVWTMNVRALRHICALRTSEAAEEEIAIVAGMILEIMMKEEPVLFGDFAKDEKGYWKPKYEKV